MLNQRYMPMSQIDNSSNTTSVENKDEINKNNDIAANDHSFIVHNWKIKTFTSLTFCDHCGGLIFSIICTQGYQCQACNFSSHSKCASLVTAKCRLDQNDNDDHGMLNSPEIVSKSLHNKPVVHKFHPTSKSIRKFCNYCRDTTFTISNQSYICSDCRYVAHDNCRDKSPHNCRVTHHRIIQSNTHTNLELDSNRYNRHHWIEGNLKEIKPCIHCNERVEVAFSLAHYRCSWCLKHAHSGCADKHSMHCDFGELADMILPPSCVSILPSNEENEDIGSSSNNKKNLLNWRIEAPIPSKLLMIFINSKSGGQMGTKFLKKFASLVNPLQIVDLIHQGPDHGIQTIQRYLQENPNDVEKFRLLVCGGDGTVGWVLQVLKKYNLPPIPIAIIPLGTGNDMSRSLGWGPGYDNEKLTLILKEISEAKLTHLDTFTVNIKQDTKELNTIVMNNYFSIGLDANIALGFHEARNANPHLFTGRTVNKLWYGKIGLEDFVTKSFPPMCEILEITIDGQILKLEKSIEGIMIINVNNYAGGVKLWKNARGNFKHQKIDDGILEVVGVTGVPHMGSVISGVTSPIKLAQGAHILIKHKTKKQPTTAVQVDGEPFSVESCEIEITFQRKVLMLAKKNFKTKSSEFNPVAIPNVILATSPSSVTTNSTQDIPLSPENIQTPPQQTSTITNTSSSDDQQQQEQQSLNENLERMDIVNISNVDENDNSLL